MFDHAIAFDRPGYLVLLAVIPLMWRLGHRSLAGLGQWRRGLALGMRSLVALAIVLALADVQHRRRSDQLTVVYLLDQSLSIPAEQRQAMLPYVAASVERHRQTGRDDRYAVVAFGRDAAVEAPPVDAGFPPPPRLESVLDPEYTDLATAVDRAQALFPPDAAKRIVLVTDGNENRGNVYRQARAAAAAGVSIDVVPVYLPPRSEVAVEKVDLPMGVRRGQPFDIRVVLSNETAGDNGSPVAGTLRIVRKAGRREETVAEDAVKLPPGKQVITLREEIDRTDFYVYEARFVPEDPAADGLTQNNAATAFTHIRGKGNVLLIENFDQRGQFDYLVERLRAQDIEVTVTATDQLFGSLAELQRYDAVILANVARSGADDENVAAFSNEQIEMLVRNTRELGCGLIMLGGPDSFGAGGWANTKLEEAMPVDFQIKAAEVVQVGALAIVIDRSGSMDGEKLAMSKAAAIAAIRTMGQRDHIAVVAFDDGAYQVVPLRRVGNYRTAARQVDSLGSGGGTDMYPGMVMGFGELRKAQDAGAKHMIVLSDGQTPDAKFAELVRRMRANKITVTAVAVGSDANVPLLQQIARGGGGKFYSVLNPRGLPRIFLREVRRVARPLVYEPPSPVLPRLVGDHEILHGVEGGVPPIKGLVLTTVKENPLVEVLMRSPLPSAEKNATLLATWTYGAGKAAAWTTDAGSRWATAWTEWEGFDKFFSQLVRWAMRPTGDSGNFAVATDVRDGRTQVVVTALDVEDVFLNDQPITATAVGPNMQSIEIAMQQTAPGRYVGEFPSEDAGSYYIVVNPGDGSAPIRTGVNVGYSPEYRDHETNVPLLVSLAKLHAAGGRPGVLAEDGLSAELGSVVETSAASNPFRRDLPPVTSDQSVWPWVVVAASCVFFGDVFVRRVQLNLVPLMGALARIRDAVLRRRRATAPVETIRRLQSRKHEVAEQLASRHAAARLQVDEAWADASPLPAASSSSSSPSAATSRGTPAAVASEEQTPPVSYTERLLQVKKEARRERR
jgi:Mg-chelatase subunit ChlD